MEGGPRIPRNAKQFVAPSLNLFRVKDSKSTYVRTKVPACLVAADPDLKWMFNWGKITDETRPEIEANHERLVCRLRLVDARLKEGRDPAPKPVLRSAPADMPASVTELVQQFIKYEINTLREARGLRVGRRLPDRYQKSIGMNIRRDPKDNMRQKYFSDADLLGPETKSEYRPEELLWSAEQMQKARTLLELAAGSERLQKALRFNGYRWPFPRIE